MTFGLIARGDQGGIATQTRAIMQQLQPSAVILLDLEHSGRGACDLETVPKVENMRVKSGKRRLLDREDAIWFARHHCDVVLTVEGWYSDDFPDELRNRGIKRVLYANPELYPGPSEPAEAIYVPTPWLITDVEDRSGIEVGVLPWPTNPRGARPHHNGLVRFVHIDAPAMLDREGTDILHAAVREIPRGMMDLTVYERNGHRNWPRWVNVVRDIIDGNPLDETDADVLVQPRRYGGLSLLQWEAAERAMGIMCLDRPPESEMVGRHLVPTQDGHPTRMKGGFVAVYNAEGSVLAGEMMKLAMDVEKVRSLQRSALAWAIEHSWDAMRPQWREALTR